MCRWWYPTGSFFLTHQNNCLTILVVVVCCFLSIANLCVHQVHSRHCLLHGPDIFVFFTSRFNSAWCNIVEVISNMVDAWCAYCTHQLTFIGDVKLNILTEIRIFYGNRMFAQQTFNRTKINECNQFNVWCVLAIRFNWSKCNNFYLQLI